MEWTGYSGLIGIGVKMPVSDTWSFRPSVDLAWSHFVNDTEFSGPGAHDFQELLDGVNTNWVLDTITYVGSLRFDYRREVGKTMCHFTGKYSHMHTDFLHDDHILNDFHASNNILTGQIDFKGPFELSIRENKLGWDLFAAHYRFEGEVGSLLGVVDFYSEAGFFIRTDFYKKKLVAESLSLGFSYVFGDHIEGLTFRLSAKL